MSSSKGYESRAVQTTFSPPCSPSSVFSPQPLPVDGGPHSEMSTPTVDFSPETPGNPSQSSDGSLISYLSTPDNSMTTSRRVVKSRLGPNFPSRVTHTITQRIVSEPGTAPIFSIKSQIASQQRIVSMPEDVRSQRLEKEFVLYPPEYDDSPVESSNSFSTSDGNGSFARADVTGTDISHQSSSPSSPDSVVIIQNKYHISQAFLRQTCIQTKAKTDEDWMTWASSPPRPIPALHGPSSLPYARCPSGAEGTIIDEQDNLPRMIWGLDQETVKPEITPSEPPNRAPGTITTPGTIESVPSIVAPHNPPSDTNLDNAMSAADQKTLLPNFIEPIDLGPMLAHVQEHAYQPPQIGGVRTAPIGATDVQFHQKAHYERYPYRKEELGVGLKPLPRRNETYKNTKPLVTTQPVVGSSLPVIILESQPQSISVPTKRRQSAMEIAQQYRKNQALFQPVAQSQWPSNPSYSAATQAIRLPTLPTEIPELSLLNQTRVYNHSAGDVHLATSASVDAQQISGYGSHRSTGLSRVHKALTSPGSDFGSYPRPPPNTPMNALAKSRTANAPLQINHFPESPDSPSTAIRSLQYSKLAPLSRHTHRRLSAVLETSEDQNSSVGLRSLSPPPFQQNFHLSRPLIPDGIGCPSSSVSLGNDRQSYYRQLENSSKVNTTFLSEDFARLTVEPFVPGWTHSHSQFIASSVKADPQPAQRGHKTGKAGTSGKAKGPGQKNQPQGQATGKRNRSKKKIANGMVVIAA